MKKTILASIILVIVSGCSNAEEKTQISTIRKLNTNDTLVYIPASKNHVIPTNEASPNMAYIRAGHIFEQPVPVKGVAINAIVVMSQYTFDCNYMKSVITSEEITNGKNEVYTYDYPNNQLQYEHSPDGMQVLLVACDYPDSMKKELDQLYDPVKPKDIPTSPGGQSEIDKSSPPVDTVPPVQAQPLAVPKIVPVPAAASEVGSWSPSFDCAKASTGPERLICNSKELSEADVQLNQVYKLAISKSADPVSLRNSERDWRKTNRDACADIECMLKVYQMRINELRNN
ncbi:MAG: lysozyme inhibitor LprI family protein [Candidatus Saccharibacteria bacterium]